MATKTWRGDAPAIAHVVTLTIGGTIEADDNFHITINGKTRNVTAGSTTAADVATSIADAWNALAATSYPEFAEITANAVGATVVLTADRAGVPFSVTLQTTESGGGAADAQTFVQTTTTTATGPNDVNNAANWEGGLPANGDDVVFTNSTVDALYNLSALSAVTLGSLTVTETYSGKVGLPRMNSGSAGSGATPYLEYRATYLRIGATSVTIRGGGGRIKIDTGSAQTSVNVLDSGSSAESNVPTILWKGTHASNTVSVSKGNFGAAFHDGETATIATLAVGYRTNRAGDATVILGGGCTLTTITKSGGALTINSNVTTLNHDGGETIQQLGTLGTLNLYSGQMRYRSAGTMGTASIYNGAELDFRQDNHARTVTNCTLYDGATLRDPMKTVTFTNPVACKGPISGQGSRSTLELGTDFAVQRS